MTIVRPCRLITRQRSHIGLTDARTFKLCSLLVAVDDPAAGQGGRGKLGPDAVTWEDADVVLAHLPGDLGEDVVSDVRLDPEHRARQGFHDLALDLDFLFLCRQWTSRRQIGAHAETGARRATIVAKALRPTS